MPSAVQRAVRTGLWVLGASLWAVGPAAALQFTLNGDERINQFLSGLPGTSYQTAPGGVDYDQIGSGELHEGEVQVAGTIPSLNYHTTGTPGTNVNQDFDPDLTFTLEAALTSVSIALAGPTSIQITLEFSGTADGLFDVTVLDPWDGTTALQANLVSGSLNGNPVAALTARGTFDCGTITAGNCDSPPENVALQTFAFFRVNPDLSASPYSSLFADGLGSFDFDSALSLGAVTNFKIDGDSTFDWNDIVAAISPGGLGPQDITSLISSTAQASGSIFSVSSSNFEVPEPAALALLALGLGGLCTRGWRRGW